MHVSRRHVRLFAAAVSAAMAVMYFLIGIGFLSIGAPESDQGFLLAFGGMAGAAFLVLAVLLVAFDKRWMWVLAVIFQVFVYLAYFEVSKDRTPPFEAWGITLRIIQAPLLVALTILAVGSPGRAELKTGAPRTGAPA